MLGTAPLANNNWFAAAFSEFAAVPADMRGGRRYHPRGYRWSAVEGGEDT